jgi:SPP1 family phage portal protein
MYRFQYPADEYNELDLKKNIILNLITKHFSMVGIKHKNKEYYEGKHEIFSRKRDSDDNAIDVKIVCNHAKDITDTATGYFMGNPITYSNTDEADIEPLMSAFDDADVDDVDADLAQDMSIYGMAYEYDYAKRDESKPMCKCISPLSTFIVVDDTIEENELFGVYYYPKRDDAKDIARWVATISTQHYNYTLFIENNPEKQQAVTEEPTPHYFGGIQIIEYLNNKEGIGDFEQQIPLIDAYNTLMSDRVTDKEQFIDAIMVLYGSLLGDDEKETAKAQEELKAKKLLELPLGAKAEYLTRTMDEGGVEILRKALKEDIYNFSHVPNLTDENFAGNSSGVAMEYKLLGLEMITKTKERYYRRGLQKRITLFCNYLNMQAMAQDASSVVPTFSRSLPKNLQELASTLYSLKDFVSMRTLIKQIPFVEDPDDELKAVKEEKAEAVKQQQDMFLAGENAPPDDEEETDEDEPDIDEPDKEKKRQQNTRTTAGE